MRPRPPLLRTVLTLGGAFLALAVALCFFVRIDRVVDVPGRLVGASRAVRAPRAGLVREVLVEVGQHVEEGTVLLRLDRREALDERARLAAVRAAAATRLSALGTERERTALEAHPAQRAALEREALRTRLVLEAAEEKAERYRGLREQGLVQGVEVEEAELARDLARVDREEAVAELALVPEREVRELAQLDAELDAQGHELEEADLRLAELDRALLECDVAAPRDGWVVGPPARELTGRAVAAGEAVWHVAAEGAQRFVGACDDRGRARLSPGLRARVRLSGYPWLLHGTTDATLVGIAVATEGGDGFRVELDLDPASAPGPLFDGMQGTARVVTQERVSLLRLAFEELAGVAQR